MKSKLILLLLAWQYFSICHAQSVVINKIYNSGITSPAGQDDIVELLVVEDHLDMRNMVLKDFSGANSGQTTTFSDGGALRFKDIPFWHSVRAGTVIVLRRNPSGSGYVEDADANDKVLDLRIASTFHFDYQSIGDSFNITNYDMVMIKTGAVTGVANAIHTVTFGIGANNTTFNSVTGAKMRTNKISPTGGFLYPMNSTITLADFDSIDQLHSSTTAPLPLTWGIGTGDHNVAFVNKVREFDYAYVHKSGNELIGGHKIFNGNVSIGTTDPKGYKLAVAGHMIAEDVKVKLRGDWPDYVFGRDYELPSLSKLEEFIREHKHLPGVPSEKEVQRSGDISLGELNKILLEKVEELTLHLIEQQKVINGLLEEKNNGLLKKK